MSIKQNCGRLFKLALMTIAAMVFSFGAMWAQNSKVSGKVTDKSGEPLAGVYVLVQGTKIGTSTDANGAYVLSAPSKGTLIFTYMGFNTATVAVNGRSSVNVVMEESATTLNDVVVVGFGTQKKVNLTGAVSSVDVGKTFNSKPITDVSKGLQGTVPGLTITFATNDLGASPSIKVRGTGSINGNNKPLVLLDGVEIPDLSFVNPDNIKSISVLKDAASASIYGTRAAFGVVLITSKDGSNMTDKVQITYSNNFSWNEPIALPKYCVTKEAVIKQLNYGIIAQKNVDGSDVEGFGMYYKDLIDPISNWFDKYKSQVNGEVWKYGRDYTYNAKGIMQSYRVSNPNTETMKKFAFQHNHNFTITGNTGKTNYNIAVGYSKQDGQLKKASVQYVQRSNLNLSTNTQIFKWLNIGTKVMYTEKMQKYPNGYDSSDGAMGLIYYDMRFPTWFPYGISDGAVDDSGNYLNAKTQSGAGLQWRQGNGFVVGYPTCTSTDEYLTLGANLKANIYKGLTITAEYTRGKLNYENKTVYQPVYVANWWNAYSPTVALTSTSRLANTWVKTTSNTFNTYVDYNYNLLEDHHFAFKVGMNTEDYKYNMNYLRSDGVQNYNLPVMGLTDSKNAKAYVDESLRDRASAGFFARVNYDYKGIYLLELNGRYDGSSLFKEGDKWAFFPSMSVGYRISQEKYWDPIKKYVSNLKIRASYGSIGNQNISSSTNFYPFMSLINPYTTGWIVSDGTFATSTGMPTIIGKNMTWEKIRTLDFGFDAGFLDNELNVVFDWYQRKNVGMLVDRNAVVDYGGFPNLPQENSGDLKTTGWELQIDYNHSFNKDLSVYATFTLSDATSKITKWNSSVGKLQDYYEGKQIGEIWGFETDRYWTSADDAATIKAWQGNLQKNGFVYTSGDIKYKDLDGDKNVNTGEGTIYKHGDLKRIGNTTPRYEYSLRIGAAWKGIDAEVLFQGVGKRDMCSYSSLFLPLAEGSQMNVFTNQLDYWTENNTNAKFPRPYFGGQVGSSQNGLPYGGINDYYPQTKYLQNLAYLRVKNVTIGYTVPAKLSAKAFLQKIRVYVSAQNLFTFDHIDGVMDPELTGGWNTASGIDSHFAGKAMPFNRQWSFGVQVTF